MIKKILSLALVAVTALIAGAQNPNPLPLNPAVKHGTLPNGLNYYIMHNEEPKQRVNFYIAQKVGSTLETPEQLGLAHFLEHMAFNGTKNYPGKAMLNYLQSKGIRFGADINAYTAYDETVYNINNVPTTDEVLMDSVLLVLHDWSGSILLEEDEINAERGVIEEEWRSRNDAMQRWREATMPQIYQEYQYQQSPIGKMEVVRNFPPQVLRDYYHKWYRPDQQGIVIVGDIDVDAMEKKVIEMFTPIPMPENAAERTYAQVSDNKEPIFTYFKDKEFGFPMILVCFKSDVLPREYRNTDLGWMNDNIELLISTMIDNRLNEYSRKPECKYSQAGVNFGNYMTSKTKSAFTIQIIGKDDIKGAYDDAMAIVIRACKTGFMDSELVRARDELLSQYEKAYNERNNTKSDNLAKQIIRHFVDNDSYMGAENEYMLAKQMLTMIPVQAINMAAAQILTDENQVICVAEPEREGMTVVTREDMVGGLNNMLNAQYEAYVDEVITEPLISKFNKPGKVKSQNNGAFGTTEFILSNGVKVIVKPTDFKSDEILMEAFAEGGKRSFAPEMAPYVLLAGDAFEVSKLGNFDRVKLEKYLAGKNVSVNFEIENTVNSVSGKSTVKDLETMMEMIYATFTAVSADEEAYNTAMSQAVAYLKNNDKNPQVVFGNAIKTTSYAGNPMFQPTTAALIESGNYAKELQIVKNATANAADFTFIFTGNVDMATFVPMLNKYIASLPSKGKKSAAPKQLSPITIASGIVDNSFTIPMQVPSTMVYTCANGRNIKYDNRNQMMISLLGDVLSIVYTETLREEEGGTYSPYAYGTFNPWTNTWQIVSVFQTNSEIQNKLMTRANDEFMKLLKNGVGEANFTKVKEAMARQYENSVRSNGYWLNGLLSYERGIDNLTNAQETLAGITLADFNNFLSTLYSGQDNIKVVMTGVNE